MTTVYISRYALKTGKILTAELIEVDSKGIAICRLSDGTRRHYKPTEWSLSLEEALQKAEKNRKMKIHVYNTSLEEVGYKYLKKEIIRLENMKITECDSEVPFQVDGTKNFFAYIFSCLNNTDDIFNR